MLLWEHYETKDLMGRNTHFCTVPGSPSLTDTLVMCLGNSDLTVRSLRKPLVLENHHTPSQRLPVFRYLLHLLKRRGDPCHAEPVTPVHTHHQKLTQCHQASPERLKVWSWNQQHHHQGAPGRNANIQVSSRCAE